MRDKDIQTLHSISAGLKQEIEEIRVQQAEAKKLLEQTRVEIEEITAEVVALQEEHWSRMRTAFPEIGTAMRLWIS